MAAALDSQSYACTGIRATHDNHVAEVFVTQPVAANAQLLVHSNRWCIMHFGRKLCFVMAGEQATMLTADC